MGIKTDIMWFDSIDKIEHWSAPAQDNSNFIMRIALVAHTSFGLKMVIIRWNKYLKNTNSVEYTNVKYLRYRKWKHFNKIRLATFRFTFMSKFNS